MKRTGQQWEHIDGPTWERDKGVVKRGSGSDCDECGDDNDVGDEIRIKDNEGTNSEGDCRMWEDDKVVGMNGGSDGDECDDDSNVGDEKRYKEQWKYV